MFGPRQFILDRCTDRGERCLLGTMNPRNVEFYRQIGFEVVLLVERRHIMSHSLTGPATHSGPGRREGARVVGFLHATYD